jgi:hypothetical protein
MTDKANHRLESPPTANYSSAVARAVAWLGDRYLSANQLMPHRVTPPAAPRN